MMKNILIKIIRFYQNHISLHKMFGQCIYHPTCSEYGIEAISRYGALKGGWMTLIRILKCNPFAKGGYDPVK